MNLNITVKHTVC